MHGPCRVEVQLRPLNRLLWGTRLQFNACPPPTPSASPSVPANSSPLELLAPAKNTDIGIEAIRHGADAVYIGGPAFGARHDAGNSIEDIERLTRFAHRFHARIFITLNTILRDDELEDARRLAWQVYEAGADALIVQDMGLLELDLPPIQLHASTQTDIRTPERAKFLADVGFSQIVLARELSLPEIAKIAARIKLGDDAPCVPGTPLRGQVTANQPPVLEFFIHGALCVAFSGQCYISHAHTGRSANRGECSQACRLPYNLEDKQGRIVAFDKHLLSMKDNDQSANLRALADAGIQSFKIEGRLKDMAYVKNATAHYRQLLDRIIDEAPEYARASSGRCSHSFTPRPEKSFNRGATDYFVNGRQPDIGAFDTPSFAGEASGTITRIGPDWFEIDSDEEFANGDGISYLSRGRKLAGLRINVAKRVAGHQRLFPNEMPDDPEGFKPGIEILRNRDQAFERVLEKDSAERHIRVTIELSEADEGFALILRDEDGIEGRAVVVHAKEASKNPERSLVALGESLGKLGATDFKAGKVKLTLSEPWFLPAATANALRRDAVEKLVAAREAARPRLPRADPIAPPSIYPERELSYLANVLNSAARNFYRRHGVELIADAYEADTTPGDVSLMITKHCLRYSHSLCPKEAKGWVTGVNAEPMTLVNGKERLTLRFDCKKCEMHVVGRMKKGRQISITPLAP
ncbi:MAG: U32 family peptidase [Sulfuritalea sp.]|nr:U32 family peptidase [Sulfuritalea sp.]